MGSLSSNLRGSRVLLILFATVLSFVVLYAYHNAEAAEFILSSIPILHPQPPPPDRRPPTTHAPPVYRPTPTFTPPPVTDPFPLLATSTATPPPIPEYNVPRPNMHKEYGLDRPPPLYIGFTRQWPMLLQAVISYITAGWPADNIYVVENTGVQNSNRDGNLTLQNPFYLNYTTLGRLGVNIIRTPVLLSFSQLQNFFLNQAYEHDHPYYLYSHQDVIVFSFEDGPDPDARPADKTLDVYDAADNATLLSPAAARTPGYRSIYENCLLELNRTVARGERWGVRWFEYDYLTLVNRAAMEAVGGYDALIPYYISDCDFNARLQMDGWTLKTRSVGIINDVSTVLVDLAALYRLPSVRPAFADPNPLTPEEEDRISEELENEAKAEAERKKAEHGTARQEPSPPGSSIGRRDGDGEAVPTDPFEYFRILSKVGNDMAWYKYRDEDRQRNTWQSSQRGGKGEPFAYDSSGFGRAFEVLAEAGREVFRQKWGHRECDLVEGTALRTEDQWRVEKDWERRKLR